jgi:hypothetical protein
MFASLSKVNPDPEALTLWKRALVLHDRGARARGALDQAGGARLQGAIAILVEERALLDQYVVELGAAKGRTKDLVAEVMSAAYRDVVAELGNLVMRSEVGLLDVAWAMKEAETDAVQHLEQERDRDVRDLDRSLDMGLEELEP